ncbi:hypothetical protein [Paenibacillus sp. SI8]
MDIENRELQKSETTDTEASMEAENYSDTDLMRHYANQLNGEIEDSTYKS